MTFRKGIVPQASQAAPAKQTSSVLAQRARTVPTRHESPIIQNQHQHAPQRVISVGRTEHQPTVRGVVVGTDGKLIRGLSQATVAAHQAHNDTQSEQCRNCGEFRTPAQMQNVIGNAYNPNNPLRMCKSCSELAYKDPRNASEQWKPSVPAIRFDRARGNPYDAHKAGIRMIDLVKDASDTYHREREVDPEFRVTDAARMGQWSGGGVVGHCHTAQSLEHSKERARRR